MFSEGRVTRSRAKLTGEATPLCSGLPDGKTPGTRTTRRRAATKEAEQPTPRAALFDLTNVAEEAPATVQAELPPVDETKPLELEESPAAEEAAAEKEADPEVLAPIVKEAAPIAEEQAQDEGVMASSPVAEVPAAILAEAQEEGPLASEDSVPTVAREASEEAPATPPTAPLPVSPAQAVPAPTPTGLGLSSLAPMSPLGMQLNLAANTPMATPLQGVPATAEAKVFDMLNAAAKAMEEHGEAPTEEEAPASAGPLRGFGSPVKFSESPAMSVSFGGPELSLGCSMQQDEGEEVASASPAGTVGMLSPAMDYNVVSQASPAPESPAMFSTAAATPASPVDMPQEAEDQEADPMEEMSLERPVSMPTPVPEAAQPEAAKPKLRSKVAVASPFDPRSLRQLRKEIKEKATQKEAASAANSEAEDEYEEAEEYYEAEEAMGSSELLAAMGNLNLGSPEVALDPYALRGLPKPAGTHIRFEDDGTEYVSPKLKTKLRGLATPAGRHQYFSDDDE